MSDFLARQKSEAVRALLDRLMSAADISEGQARAVVEALRDPGFIITGIMGDAARSAISQSGQAQGHGLDYRMPGREEGGVSVLEQVRTLAAEAERAASSYSDGIAILTAEECEIPLRRLRELARAQSEIAQYWRAVESALEEPKP